MSEEYYVSKWAVFLHSFPRWDFYARRANSTFNIEGRDSNIYIESVLVWGALPIGWLLFSLLLFLVYFCYRCCQRDVETKQRMPCLMWTLAILALVTCCVLGVGFAGVVETKRGNDEVVDALEDMSVTMSRALKQVDTVQRATDDIIASTVSFYNKISPHSTLNDSFKLDMVSILNATELLAIQMVKDLAPVRKITNDSRVKTTADNVKMGGLLMALVFSCFFGLCLLQCLILLLAVGRSSKCTLLVYCALGIMTMVLLWMVAGILLTSGMVLGDFCVEPNKHVENAAARKGSVEEELVKYYVECHTGVVTSLLTDAVQLSNSRIAQMNQKIQTIVTLTKKADNLDLTESLKKFQAGIDAARVNLLHLHSMVDCSNIHEDYIDILDGVCHFAMCGAVLMWFSCVFTALLFTILVILASKAWRHLGKGKGYELVTYEANPYAREPPDAGLSPSSCQFYSCSRGSRGNPREHVALHHRTTPPPAYNCNEFYRTYSDMNHLTDDQRSDVVGGHETPA